MERYLWKASIKEGSRDEYIRRHREIWPELVEVLKQAGICNYSIWEQDGQLIGYYECEQGCEYAARIQAESPVVDRWNEFMKDILIMDFDPTTGAQKKLEQVFYLK